MAYGDGTPQSRLGDEDEMAKGYQMEYLSHMDIVCVVCDVDM